MYPVYPLLAVNAAIALHAVLSVFGSTNPKSLVGKIPPQLKLLFVSFWVLLAVALGILRTVGVVTAYGAPMEIYKPLQNPELVDSYDAVCLGKEWYRFPSSFFIPPNMRARFVKSEFNGLLPGQFHEGKIGFGLFAGTWLIPPGMNDQNIEDPGKYVSILLAFANRLLTKMCRPMSSIAPISSTLIFRAWSPQPCSQTMF